MTVEFLSVSAGVVLSLVLAYFPKLKDKFNALESGTKQLVTLSISALLGLIIFGLGCVGWAEAWGLPSLECSVAGLQQLLKIIFQVASGAILTYGGTKYIHKS